MSLAPALLMHAGQLDLAPQGLTVESRPLGTDDEASGSEAPEVGPAVQQAMLGVFYANLYVGKVWHNGGFELLPEVGNQVRSLGLGFSQQGEYAQQVQEWTNAALGEVLTLGGTAWSLAPSSVEAALVAPLVRKVRGTGPLDGEDNQNLPRFTLEPQPLDPAALPAIDAPALLVPMVVHYYAHNGGWFVGQAQGAPAGARFRLLWVLHDTKTGAVRTWGDVSARHVEPYFYTPNDVQLQDYLLQVEAQVRDGLVRQLAR
ncbi:MAG: hypothetical protein VKS61_15110 [Candidatus Sericytochromatia bacterium]|nr:hypothetical protein [Candidatus Sericytochromatia bacterium]